MVVSKAQIKARKIFAEHSKKRLVPEPVTKEKYNKILEKFYYEFLPRHGYYGHIGGGDERLAKQSVKEKGYFVYQWQDEIIEAYLSSVFFQRDTDLNISILRQVGKTDIVALCTAFILEEYYNVFGKEVKVAVFAPTKRTSRHLFDRSYKFMNKNLLAEDGDTKEEKTTLRGDSLNLFGIYDEVKGSTIEGFVFDIILRDEAHKGSDEKFIDETEPTRFSRGGTMILIGNGGKSECLFYHSIRRGTAYDAETKRYTKLVRYTWNEVEPYLEKLASFGLSTAQKRLNGIRSYIKQNGSNSYVVRKNLYCKWSLELGEVVNREQLLQCVSLVEWKKTPLFMGLDIATLHDRTIATIMDEEKNIIDWIVVKDKDVVSRAREQIEFLAEECKERGYLEHLVGIGFDATGLGSFGVIELLEEFFMCDLVEYKFAAQKKHDWYEAAIETFYTDFKENRIKLPMFHPKLEEFIKDWVDLRRKQSEEKKYDSFFAKKADDCFDDYVSSYAICLDLWIQNMGAYQVQRLDEAAVKKAQAFYKKSLEKEPAPYAPFTSFLSGQLKLPVVS